jgi:hypothetical protein
VINIVFLLTLSLYTHTDGLILHIVRKEVTRALKEFMETTKKRELAATKIQAAFRGHRARKLYNMNIAKTATHKYADFKSSKAKDSVSPDRQSVDVSTFYVY